jgi:spore germination cell wall hydrolase CwlJ-like protein
MLKIKVTWEDIDILSRTIFGEARGEPLAGKIAVGRIIINRAEIDLGNDGKPDWWGETIKGVCLQPYQFSCWNSNDPNRSRLLTAQLGDRVFATCLAAAGMAIAGDGPPWIAGCTHYHARGVMPAWAKGKAPAGVIGQHLFYAGIK